MRFMTRALCLGAISAGLLGMIAPGAQAAPPPPLGAARSYTAGKYALEFDGAVAGWVRSAEGGNATATVVEEPGSLFYAKKHLANVRYHAITLELGPGMTDAVWSWIENSLEGNFERRSGAIVAVDYQMRITSVREFYNAIISEIEFPAADAASKEPARIRLTLQPEFTRTSAERNGSTLQVPLCKSPMLLSSNFRLTIDSIGTTKARAVAPLSVRIVLTESPVGEQRDYQQEATKVSFPDVYVTLAQTALQGFNQWFEDFVIQGNNSDEQEKSGSLEYLTPNLTQSPFRLDFKNMGIFEIEPQTSQGSAIAVSTVKMYVEHMEFIHTGASCGVQ